MLQHVLEGACEMCWRTRFYWRRCFYWHL